MVSARWVAFALFVLLAVPSPTVGESTTKKKKRVIYHVDKSDVVEDATSLTEDELHDMRRYKGTWGNLDGQVTFDETNTPKRAADGGPYGGYGGTKDTLIQKSGKGAYIPMEGWFPRKQVIGPGEDGSLPNKKRIVEGTNTFKSLKHPRDKPQFLDAPDPIDSGDPHMYTESLGVGYQPAEFQHDRSIPADGRILQWDEANYDSYQSAPFNENAKKRTYAGGMDRKMELISTAHIYTDEATSMQYDLKTDSFRQAHRNDVIYAPRNLPQNPGDVSDLSIGTKAVDRAAHRTKLDLMMQNDYAGLTPNFPVIHPSVQMAVPHAGDFEKLGSATYLSPPPDPMPPQPPYLYPPHKPGEFEYTVPAEYAPFYPKEAPPSYPEVPATCVPVEDLPFIRTLAPSKYMDDYCVPIKYLPFYHPTTWREHSGANQPPDSGVLGQKSAGGHAGEGGASSPFFVANPAPPPQFSLPLPFSHAPRFPAFSSPDGSGAPPPGPPPPPPANYPVAHLANKVPPLPPPPMPPPMWPFG